MLPRVGQALPLFGQHHFGGQKPQLALLPHERFIRLVLTLITRRDCFGLFLNLKRTQRELLVRVPQAVARSVRLPR